MIGQKFIGSKVICRIYRQICLLTLNQLRYLNPKQTIPTHKITYLLGCQRFKLDQVRPNNYIKSLHYSKCEHSKI